MLGALHAGLLGLALAASPGPIKLASPGLSAFKLPAAEAAYHSDRLAHELTLQGVQVITPTQIAALLGLERQKELLGCAESSSSCMAELANALGVDGIVTGSVGKFGEAYQVDVQILSASDGRPLAVYSNKVSGEDALLDEFRRAAQSVAEEVSRKLGRSIAEPPSVTGRTSSWKRWWWLPAGGGVALGVAGSIFLAQSRSHLDRLNGLDPSITDPYGFSSAGQAYGAVGGTMVAVGAAAITLGVLSYFFAGDAGSATIGAVFTPEGGAFAVSVILP